jgi:mono/diheme cytochrome c family protein
MKKELVLFCVAVLLLVWLFACSSPTPTPLPTPVPPTATPRPTEPPPVVQTEAGAKAYSNFCAGCHAAGFDISRIAKYGSAKKLYEFIAGAMPPGNPDIVSPERRYDIVAHLLSESAFLPSGQRVSAETAANITFVEPTPPASVAQVESGGKAFGSYCSCHGNGFAKRVINSYGTADKLYEYIRQAMPPGNPDVLTDKRRYDIVSYLLNQHDLLKAGQEVNSSTAGSISAR